MKLIVKKILPDYKSFWKSIGSVIRKILQTKIQVLEKPTKIDSFYQIVLFVAKKPTFIKDTELRNFND